MQTGMLGNSETLRHIWDGPLKDLIIKLNGENGPEVLEELNKFNRQKPCWVSRKGKGEISEPEIIIPDLRSTGSTLADWLKAREALHQFFTGGTVILRDMFAFTDEELASRTLIPAFRPAGATNEMAVLWKRKMGVPVFVEDENKGGVMRYKNSKGLKEPELHLINRSVRPDEDTLGDNAKSPDGLIQVPQKLWLGHYGWCDTDTLHFAITGKHLDQETWCWFPEDRLPGDGRVAYGGSGDGGVELHWGPCGRSRAYYGARSAKKAPLRPRT